MHACWVGHEDDKIWEQTNTTCIFIVYDIKSFVPQVYVGSMLNMWCKLAHKLCKTANKAIRYVIPTWLINGRCLFPKMPITQLYRKERMKTPSHLVMSRCIPIYKICIRLG